MPSSEGVGASGRSASGPPYSQARRAGDWLVVGGQAPVDETGTSVALGDPAGQWRRCLENIRSLVESAGGTMGDVFQMNMFVTNIRFYLDHGEIRREFFSEPFPAQTVVGVTSLARPEWVIEIEALAYLGQ